MLTPYFVWSSDCVRWKDRKRTQGFQPYDTCDLSHRLQSRFGHCGPTVAGFPGCRFLFEK